MKLDADQLMNAYAQLAAQFTEHDSIEQAAESLGIDPPMLYAVETLVATKLDDTLSSTPYWPPETEVQRATGLGVAFGLGLLTILQAMRVERVG